MARNGNSIIVQPADWKVGLKQIGSYAYVKKTAIVCDCKQTMDVLQRKEEFFRNETMARPIDNITQSAYEPALIYMEKKKNSITLKRMALF